MTDPRRMSHGMQQAAVAGATLEYEVRGEGAPVLLIHGSHIAASFLPLAAVPGLRDHHRLIRYHRRGFAGSTKLDAPYSIEQQAADAAGVLRHLRVPRAHVIGHSYGGATALQLALDAPEAVHSLVLLEPALMMVPSGAEFLRSIEPAIERYAAGDAALAVDLFARVVCAPDWEKIVESTVPGGPEQARCDAATFFDVEFPALNAWEFDAGKAAGIKQPVLYVLGRESPPVFDEGRQLIRAWIAHSEEAGIPDANHLLQMQTPDEVARVVSDFLGRHPL